MGLELEVSPRDFGRRTPGGRIDVKVAIVNRSTSRTYSVLTPAANAWLGSGPPLAYSFEERQTDGSWKRLRSGFFLGHGAPFEQPGQVAVLPPGERVVLKSGVPPLEIPEDFVGQIRARLTYDVGAERARHSENGATRLGDPIVVLTSNPITGHQVPGPLELRLEQIGKVKVGVPLDPSAVFRIVLNNRSQRDVTFYSPGSKGSLGFSIYKPNGGVWPKGERPVMGLTSRTSKTITLGPGKSVELFGTSPAFGPTPATWSYPAVETFRIRAMFSQPGPGPNIHYSKYITVTSVK